jgi:membrane protein implicated in regulation of membrane protease activity
MTTLIAIAMVGAAGVYVLTRTLGKLGYRAQFMVLCGLGLSIGFLFLAFVELPSFSVSVGVLLVSIVFVASLFAVRIFLQSLDHENDEWDADKD